MSKEVLYEKFSTGKKPTGEDFKLLIDSVGVGIDGVDGVDGKDGKEGASIASIALTTVEGVITGGEATLTDETKVPITITGT